MTLASALSPSGLAEPSNLAASGVSASTRVLRQGSQGDAVEAVQARLWRLGYDPGPLDGHFGPQTERAVRQFQEVSHLVVDGVVGPITWQYLGPGQGHASGLGLSGADAAPPALATHPVASALSDLTWSIRLSLHPMAVLPEDSPSRRLGLVVVGFGLAGLVTYFGFRPDAALGPRRLSTTPPSSPVHAPQPIYPARAGLPHPSESTLSLSPTQPLDPAPLPLDPPIASTLTHLPNFVYDLLQPYDRHQLEIRIQGKTAAEDAAQPPPMLAALLQRVGVLPEHNYRTGMTYTYVLLDDVGGCLRLCGNELWLTSIAHQWFQPDVMYTALIRRIDAAGQVLDKTVTVSLSRQQLDWVA